MSYYPKSQIKTNLYANGPDTKLTTQPLQQQLSNIVVFYIGPYYETSTGNKYTGKSPGDGVNVPLFLVTDYVIEDTPLFPENFPNQIIINPLNDIQILPTVLPPRFLPLFNQPSPTQQDYTLGSFTRYFCKKTNELKYIEINKETHDKLKTKDTQIAWDLYEPYSITWQIKGNQESTLKANKSIVLLTEQRQKWYGFSQYLKEDYLKYYLGE